MQEIKNIRLLLVEDDEDDLLITRDILEEIPHYKFDIHWASNPALAREILPEKQFDICLCDFRLGMETGLEVIKHIKENYDHIPVIMLTGQDDFEIDSQALKDGASDYLIKGRINASVLGRSIRYAMEHKKAQLRLKESEAELRKSNATKDKFFSIIAHDLRSPFTALLSLSDILLKHYNDLDDDTKKEYIGMIKDSSENTFKLIENLLQWSRIQRGTIEINPSSFNICDLVNRTIGLLKQSADGKNIEITSCLNQELPAFADINMVDTVIRNLMMNSIKFTQPEGKISIEGHLDNNSIYLSIADTGVGMTQKTMDKLFKVEENKSTPGTAGELGTGLGLILCKEFITINKGDILVESEPGKGSKFTVVLPAKS
ncbi:MAG: hybrid sensor histidine kinase/response regulator [Bacteroidetes bacterium]|nr:hybrid sensor histidine kinase/response regulator [Bacteroidota bacterium]